MNQKTVIGILVSLLYINISFATNLIQLPTQQLPDFLYPIEPPIIILPSPFEQDCWVGSDNYCWTRLSDI